MKTFYHTMVFSLHSTLKELSGLKISYIFTFIKVYVFQIADISYDNKLFQ